jgi:outer membrane biosynthesis protein TonB
MPAMSTASETQPEAVPPTTAKPPFYRRPLVLIIAGAVVLLLIVGGILGAVSLVGKHPAAHLAAGATSHPTTAGKTPAPTATPTVTPTPTATAVQPQPQAGNAPAPNAATAPVAPVAPAPQPPTNAGPTRTAPTTGVKINSLTATPNDNCPAAATTSSTFSVTIAWGSSNGTAWTLHDDNANVTYPVAASGSKTFTQLCTAGGGHDFYDLTVTTTKLTANPKKAVQSVQSTSYFHG